MNRFKKVTAAAVCCILLASIAGCSKEEGNSNSSGSSTDTNISDGTGITPPDNYIDNSPSDPLEYTSSEIYSSIGNIGGAAIRDEQAYIDGEGFQYRFTANLLTTETEGTAPCISDMKKDIGKIIIGNKKYDYDDLIRDKTQGIEVVRMLAKDFGVNICDGTGKLIERKGNIQDTNELRNAYSDRVEYDDYTACTYYFDAAMNDLDADTYARYREKYAKKYGTDSSEYLDGILAVILYYDTSGHDYFYSVVISAPTYYSSEKNFEANMNTNIRKNITYCHAELENGLRVGFINRTAIMCSGMPEQG